MGLDLKQIESAIENLVEKHGKLIKQVSRKEEKIESLQRTLRDREEKISSLTEKNSNLKEQLEEYIGKRGQLHAHWVQDEYEGGAQYVIIRVSNVPGEFRENLNVTRKYLKKNMMPYFEGFRLNKVNQVAKRTYLVGLRRSLRFNIQTDEFEGFLDIDKMLDIYNNQELL